MSDQDELAKAAASVAKISAAFNELGRAFAAGATPVFGALREALAPLADARCPKCQGRWVDGRHRAWAWWRAHMLWCPEWMWAWAWFE